MIATGLYTGLRISEPLGLIRDDIDLAASILHVRGQLSRARRSEPAKRVAPKTVSSERDVPLIPQLTEMLLCHRAAAQPKQMMTGSSPPPMAPPTASATSATAVSDAPPTQPGSTSATDHSSASTLLTPGDEHGFRHLTNGSA
jgi:integrase